MNIRSVRPRAYRILKAAGINRSTSRKAGTGAEWTPGVLVAHWESPQHYADCTRIEVRGFEWYHPEVSATCLGLAVAALRAAGWQVDDDGTIRAVPGGEP